MLNKDTFNDYSIGLVDIIDNVQLSLLEKVSRQLGRGKALSDDDWKVLMMQSVNKLESSMADVVVGSAASQRKEIESITGKAINEGLRDTDEQLKGVAQVQSAVDFKSQNEVILADIAEKLTTDTRNANMTMLRTAGVDYMNMINETLAVKEFGAVSRQEAVKQVLTKWSEKGIPALVDRAGRRWQPDVYVNMVVRTNSMDIAKATQQRRAIDYGQDLILTSQHADQSPEHAPFANKIFSLSGNNPDYPPFSVAQSAGFMNRPNCRHTYTFYVPGLTNKRKQLSKTETDKVYKVSQEQRKLERNIRKYKRQATALESAGLDASVYKSKVRQAQANMRAFINESGRTRRRGREQI